MPKPTNPISDLNSRSRDIFRTLVESYIDTGEPVGSRTLSRTLGESLSAATIRNVMQDLEQLGLLNSPHVSAGRIPTQLGLRLFVDSLLEVGDLSNAERRKIEATIDADQTDVARLLDQTSSVLSVLPIVPVWSLTPEIRSADQAYRICFPVTGTRTGGTGHRRRTG